MADTYYDILGVNKEATINDIKSAFRKLAINNHPDKGGDPDYFCKINEAYECLADEDTRTKYDNELRYKQANHHIYNAGFEFMHGTFMDMFKSHMEDTIFNSFMRSNPRNRPPPMPSIEVILPITLFDVYVGGEKTVDFERLVFVNESGAYVKEPRNAVTVCGQCRGSGETIELMNNGFFVHQNIRNCQVCEGVGYYLHTGYRLLKKKCRFRHNIPLGILHGERFSFEQEGDIFYDKHTRQFYQSNIIIRVEYDIDGTNRLLKQIYEFPHISIYKVEFGDIHYEYNASIFEFITGTKFNVALPNGSFMLVKVSKLNDPIVLKGYGLPQLTNHIRGRIETRNVVITCSKRSFDETIPISQSDRIILRRIMASQYPATTDEDAILVDADN